MHALEGANAQVLTGRLRVGFGKWCRPMSFLIVVAHGLFPDVGA